MQRPSFNSAVLYFLQYLCIYAHCFWDMSVATEMNQFHCIELTCQPWILPWSWALAWGLWRSGTWVHCWGILPGGRREQGTGCHRTPPLHSHSHNHHCTHSNLDRCLIVHLIVNLAGVSHLEWFYDQISRWRNKAVGCCHRCPSRRRWPNLLRPECCPHPLPTSEWRSAIFLLFSLSYRQY